MILFILYGMLGLACYSVCFGAIFLSQKKTQAEIDNQKSLFSEKPAPSYEQPSLKANNQAIDRSYRSSGEPKLL